MNSKYGSYITKLMTLILDNNQEKFVQELAISELNKLSFDMKEFIRKNTNNNSDEVTKNKKQLLQEDK